jgi:hypothetical protein
MRADLGCLARGGHPARLIGMLAYVFWHRPAPSVEAGPYEQAIEHFHRSLAHRPPSGFRGSAAFRAAELPWLERPAEDPPGSQAGYEDWYLVDGWSAIGVLEEAAVSRGHLTAHDAAAALSGVATGAVYRLCEGHTSLGDTRVGVWVTSARGPESPSIAALLGDGMDRAKAGLWRRCLALGPAPEYCLLASEAPVGVAPIRLPAGWRATASGREVLWHG